MPNRLIKETIWTSPNLNLLSGLAERHFYRLLPLPDDHGCCEITPVVVKGRCYPLQDGKISTKQIEKWNMELEQADIIRTWCQDGRQFAYFVNWSTHQRVRSRHKRKTPPPPSTVVNCRQLPSIGAMNPNPNPNPNPSSMSGKPDVLEGKISQQPVDKSKNCGKLSEQALRVLEFLNEKAGKNFRPVKANLDLIMARLKDSSEDECRQVIALKCRKWKGHEKWDQFLRPATLFSARNYAQYQGELTTK